MNTTKYFCDSCAVPILIGEEFFYDKIPCDIASANAGESATVCRKCSEMIEANANNEYFKKNHR